MENYNLDQPLLSLTADSKVYQWTVRNAVEGIQIFGGIGSGKTSGSGRTLALRFLSAGFGGLVLTVKPDEKELWEDYCRSAGRLGDLIVVEPGKKNFFNFLDYESLNSTDGNAITENLLEVLKTVIRASEEKTSASSESAFWENALDMLIFNVIDLCKVAYGRVSIQKMYDIVQTLPKENEENDTETNGKKKPSAFDKAFIAAREKVMNQVYEWKLKQTAQDLRRMLDEGTLEQTILNEIPDGRVLKFVDQFFSDTFKKLAERTRSIIDFSFSGFLFRLVRDPVYSLFCLHQSTFTPEDCLKGKIILINLPVKLYHKMGRDAQIMFKYIWQRSMEKRNVKINGRPLFLWADEAQNFLHEHDPDYQATARSSRIATVYLSQNLPNYHANMGGAKSDDKVKSFLGTLATKIFHANADIETNKYASELIGEGFFEDTSRTATAAGQFSTSRTKTLKTDRVVRAEQFARLKTGGPKNNFCVEGFMHVQGDMLAANSNYIRIRFRQQFNS